MISSKKLITLCGILTVWLIAFQMSAFAVDVLNCSKCHQHKNLKVITKEGVLRDFHVNPDVFNTSAHQKLTCQTCHSYIKKTPHDPVTFRKIDCSVACHLEDDRFAKDYTHLREYNQYVRSTHGEANEDSIGCVACHIEHSEKRKAEFSGVDINNICVVCHAEDSELMAKHKLSTKVVDTYKDSMHGKAVNFEVRNSASCVSCHTTHEIRRHDDIKSSTHVKQKKDTCKTEECHGDAMGRFGKGVSHQLYRGGMKFLFDNLEFLTSIWVFLGVGIILFHYVFVFLRKLSQENWRYVAAFVFLTILAVMAPFILRMMMQLRSEEIPFSIVSLTPKYKSYCRSCHGTLPHRKNLVLRAFMNRHSQKLACETCHIKRAVGDGVKYTWYNGQADYLLDFRGFDFDNGSKIFPYRKIGGKKIVIKMADDGALPLDYTVNKKGQDCSACHTEAEKGILSFASLSYSRAEIKNFRTLEEYEMLTKEKEWIVPTLF